MSYAPGMTTYTVLPHVRQPGFKVEIVGDDGARNTMLGFDTQQEAEQWVVESMRMEARLRPGRKDEAWRN